jgi:hypothetical protein
MALAQPEGDMSSAEGRVGMLEPQVVRPKLWMLGPRVVRVESRAPRGAQPKSWAPHEVAVEVGEAGDGGATQGRTVGPPAPVSRVV